MFLLDGRMRAALGLWSLFADSAADIEPCVDRVVERAVLRECTPVPYLFGHEGQEL